MSITEQALEAPLYRMDGFYWKMALAAMTERARGWSDFQRYPPLHKTSTIQKPSKSPLIYVKLY